MEKMSIRISDGVSFTATTGIDGCLCVRLRDLRSELPGNPIDLVRDLRDRAMQLRDRASRAVCCSKVISTLATLFQRHGGKRLKSHPSIGWTVSMLRDSAQTLLQLTDEFWQLMKQDSIPGQCGLETWCQAWIHALESSLWQKVPYERPAQDWEELLVSSYCAAQSDGIGLTEQESADPVCPPEDADQHVGDGLTQELATLEASGSEAGGSDVCSIQVFDDYDTNDELIGLKSKHRITATCSLSISLCFNFTEDEIRQAVGLLDLYKCPLLESVKVGPNNFITVTVTDRVDCGTRVSRDFDLDNIIKIAKVVDDIYDAVNKLLEFNHDVKQRLAESSIC